MFFPNKFAYILVVIISFEMLCTMNKWIIADWMLNKFCWFFSETFHPSPCLSVPWLQLDWPHCHIFLGTKCFQIQTVHMQALLSCLIFTHFKKCIVRISSYCRISFTQIELFALSPKLGAFTLVKIELISKLSQMDWNGTSALTWISETKLN